MTWKFIYTYREQCKTGPAHTRCWNWSPFTSKHTWMRFSKFRNTFPKVSTLTAWISWRIASLSCSIVRVVFLYTLPFNRPQRKKSTGVRSASPCLYLFNQFLDGTLRWCTSFAKFLSKFHLACYKWTCLPVFTNEKPALFDCRHFHSRGIRFTTPEMRECATQANASHWISPNRGEVHVVFHRCRYVYTVLVL